MESTQHKSPPQKESNLGMVCLKYEHNCHRILKQETFKMHYFCIVFFVLYFLCTERPAESLSVHSNLESGSLAESIE
jgi:hypothetical protein